MADNKLYYGDNLEVLRRYVKDESVDLVYLDPPFNSRQDYNVLFAEKDGTRAASQIQAFEDTWEWNAESKRVYEELVERGDRVSDVMRAFHTFLLNSDMMAYLAMMAPRLIELHRVLKVTGSIYLHCDPTASHYLKMLMDAIFGPTGFVNEIIWKRSSAHNDAKQGSKHFGRVSDTILFYAKSGDRTWNHQYQPYDQSYIDRDYRRLDPDGRRFRIDNLQGPGGAAKGNPIYEFLGVTRYWRYKKEKMEELYRKGRIVQTRPGAVPQYKRYLDEMPGVSVQNIWTDIPVINNRSNEKLDYPTQKPEALLERIIQASSNVGDVVLDPFCGCGTAVSAAQKLSRRWIGIDITHLAIGLIKTRLQDAFGPDINKTYDVVGEPTDFESAKQLAEEDRFQFQAWALGLVGARTAHSNKKGSDRGIDGKLFFRDDAQGELKQIILSVKSGGVQVRDVRDLVGTIEREKAELGVLITLEEPSKPMVHEAVDAGFYKSPSFKDQVPRIQIRTIEELLAGKGIEYPRLIDVTFKPAPKAKAAVAENLTLGLGDPD
jgi:DNA modification methylase